MTLAKDYPWYWPVRTACHCMNPIAWLLGWKLHWQAGQSRFEIWGQRINNEHDPDPRPKLYKVY